MLPRPAGSVIRSALGGTCGCPFTTGSHQLSQAIVTSPDSPGRSASRLDAGYVVSGKFAGVVGNGFCTCTGPPSFTNVTLGRPVRRHARPLTLRSGTRAMPPCSRGTNLTCFGAFRSDARHALATGLRSATCGGFAAIQGTAGATTSAFLLELESAARGDGERHEERSARLRRTRS